MMVQILLLVFLVGFSALVNSDDTLNEEERGYVSAARDQMKVAKLTEAKDQVDYALHLYAKEKSAHEKAKILRNTAENEKIAARELEITLTPRLLIDTIEAKFNDEFKDVKDKMPGELEKAEGAVTKARSTADTMKRLIKDNPNGPNARDFLEKQYYYTNLVPLLEKNITEFKFYLNKFPSDPTLERIERRMRKWYWILHHKSQDGEIKKLLDRIEVDYNEQLKKPSPLAQSKEEFVKNFCRALARAHEEGSTLVHAVKKIEADGEFEIIHFFYDDEIDPYLTTLVNAIGLRKRKEGPRFVLKKNGDNKS